MQKQGTLCHFNINRFWSASGLGVITVLLSFSPSKKCEINTSNNKEHKELLLVPA